MILYDIISLNLLLYGHILLTFINNGDASGGLSITLTTVLI
jgi:hypothetical protein